MLDKHWERSGLEQRPASGAERQSARSPSDFASHLIGRTWADINPLKSPPS